jgi:propionyl-CoA synthetase
LSALKNQFWRENCDNATLEWYQQHIPIPVIDHWWQTESGWPMIANSLGIEKMPVKSVQQQKQFVGMTFG